MISAAGQTVAAKAALGDQSSAMKVHDKNDYEQIKSASSLSNNFSGCQARVARFHPYGPTSFSSGTMDNSNYARFRPRAQPGMSLGNYPTSRQQLNSCVGPNQYRGQSYAASRLQNHHQDHLCSASNLTERCRHVRPCLCMFLPMIPNHHMISSPSTPFIQMTPTNNTTETFNHSLRSSTQGVYKQKK